MSSIYDWSTTADNNGNIDGAIDFTEGMAPGDVNNSARAVMGRVAELVGDIGGSLAAGGTANAITVTANSAFTAYEDGIILSFTAAADNTGATTLNANAIGTKAVRKMTTGGDAALVGGEIQEGGIYTVQYSSVANSAAGGWLLLNPSFLPASTTDNVICRFDGTGGALQDGPVTLTDGGLFARTVNDNSLQIIGGTSGNGALLQLFGASHSSAANQIRTNAALHIFQTVSGDNVSAELVRVEGHLALANAGNNAIFGTVGFGNSVIWRPNGVDSGTNQAVLNNSGTFSVVDLVETSDERLKDDWEDLPSDLLERCATVRRGTYSLKDSEKRHVGAGAQSLAAVLPEAVVKDETGTYRTAYGHAALAISLEAADRIVAMERRLEALEAQAG